jgi:hypothetical protein
VGQELCFWDIHGEHAEPFLGRWGGKQREQKQAKTKSKKAK